MAQSSQKHNGVVSIGNTNCLAAAAWPTSASSADRASLAEAFMRITHYDISFFKKQGFLGVAREIFSR